MKNILLITSVYISDDIQLLNNTAVCHYFAKEWVKAGYNVKVIYNYTIYSRVFHLFAKVFEKQIARVANSQVATYRLSKDRIYTIDDVHIYRFPLYKFMPRGAFSKKTLQKQISKIVELNKKDQFYPDIIVGHFLNPSIKIVSDLKDFYKVPSCVVLHGHGSEKLKTLYKDCYKELISNIDIWGYRSLAIKIQFEANFGKMNNSFICHSGVPNEFIQANKERNFTGPLTKFIYVGALIHRKYPSVLVDALNAVYEDKSFNLQYIGTGAEDSAIRKKIKQYNLSSNISLLGNRKRKQIPKILQEAECFIMVSQNETFGLVYLEAMAVGCITIASKGEGMDGIIKDGVNGFLCKSGDVEELTLVIKKINALNSSEKKYISQNAAKTAFQMSDSKVAEEYAAYLKSIIM